MTLYKDLSDKILGMVFELYLAGISFEMQKVYELTYKRYPGGRYIADLAADTKIIIELKAVKELTSLMDSQIIHYLKISGIQIGYLINFKAERVRWKRYFNRRE